MRTLLQLKLAVSISAGYTYSESRNLHREI